MEKLVRDNIPQIMRTKGEKPEVRLADYSERCSLLRQKLVEEASELSCAAGRDKFIEELTDVKEVFDVLLEHLHILPQEIERKQGQKRAVRGGFETFVVLTMPD